MWGNFYQKFKIHRQHLFPLSLSTDFKPPKTDRITLEERQASPFTKVLKEKP